jgi:hypothetical protein
MAIVASFGTTLGEGVYCCSLSCTASLKKNKSNRALFLALVEVVVELHVIERGFTSIIIKHHGLRKEEKSNVPSLGAWTIAMMI